jgi:hypothetical protein
MRRILALSIWAADAIPADEWKYRNLKRVMFPVIDFLFILGGFSAARYGIPAISEFFPDPVVDLFAYALSAVAFGCLLGVAFPRLWALEALAKSALLSLITGYVAALFLLTAVGEGNRGFVLIIAAVALCPVVWRLTMLGGEWQDRRLAAKNQEA